MFEIDSFIVAGKFFLVIAGELILIFVAVSFLIGVLMTCLPPSQIRDFLTQRLTWVQYLLGAGLGAITPFCSCSTVPITAGLLKGGVPFGPVMAFLFSSPVLNPVIIALLLSLLGYQVTVMYIIVTFFGSMVMAALLSRMGMESQVKPLVGLETACCGEQAKPIEGPMQTGLTGAVCCSSEGAPLVTPNTLPAFSVAGGCCNDGGKTGPQKADQGSCCTVNFDGEGGRASAKAPFSEKMKRASLSAVVTFKGVFWYLLLEKGW